MRANRLVSLALLLQARGRVSASALAAELEVSVRTVYRDIAALNLAGAALAQLAVALAQTVAMAMASQCPRSSTSTCRGGSAGSEPVPWLRTLAAAVHDRRQLRLGYRRGSTDDETTRVVCPLGLVNKAGTWYLVAADGKRAEGGDGAAEDDPTVFRVGRVTSACTLPEAFNRPASFDLAAFWSRWSDSFMTSRPKVEVLVRASPDALSAFPEVFGDAVRRALEAAAPADEHGFRNVTLTFEHEVAAVHRLAGFGGQVEVLAPATVRGGLIAAARELLEHYRMLANG